MKIAQVAPLIESVPPKLYGGTERVVSYLTEELVRQGHEVTLFATSLVARCQSQDNLQACRVTSRYVAGRRAGLWTKCVTRAKVTHRPTRCTQ
jgi:hypothetical protein